MRVGEFAPADGKRGILDGHPMRKEKLVSTPERRGGGIAGISTGGVIVIVGIVVMILWSFLLGLIITLVGLVAFGGFARGKWY